MKQTAITVTYDEEKNFRIEDVPRTKRAERRRRT